MIKFFRKIRQQLLSENKFSKYLIYAVGEIILVVIGILIALQVNNWNENRKSNKKELIILNSLKQEFKLNNEILDRAITLNLRLVNNIESIAMFTGPDKKLIDEFKMSMLFVGALKDKPSTHLNQGFLKELVNSGDMSFIRNANIRIKLSAWPSLLDRVKKQEQFVSVKSDETLELYLKNENFRRHLHLIKPVDHWFTLGPGNFGKNDFKILLLPQFESKLMLLLASLQNLHLNYYTQLKSELESIIISIDKELNSKS